ncbi:MAG: AI-2E family transporter [Clostridia bacterium]|nr:AI-2E family transporter [Clostridia bacterium]
MKFFRPSKRYTTLAIYACAVLAIAMLVIAAAMNLSTVLSWFDSLWRIITPVLFGFVFAYILNPLVRVFERLLRKLHSHGIRRLLSIFLTFFVVVAVVVLFIFVIVPLLVGDSQALGERLRIFIADGLNWVTTFVKGLGFEITSDTIQSMLEQYWNRIVSYLSAFGAGLVTFSYQFIIAAALSGAFIYHKEHIRACLRQGLVALFPPKVCVYTEKVASYANAAFGNYLVGKIFESIIVGTLNTIFYYVFGIPYPMLISIIMTVTDLIPVVGPWIGGIPCALLICTSDPWRVIVFVLVSLAIQQLDANFIGPKVIGDAVGLNGMWIIISIAIGGGLFGIPGMLLSAPVFSTFYMLIRDFANNRLQAKGHPTDTKLYKDLFASRAPHKAHRMRFPFLHHKKKQDAPSDDSEE